MGLQFFLAHLIAIVIRCCIVLSLLSSAAITDGESIGRIWFELGGLCLMEGEIAFMLFAFLLLVDVAPLRTPPPKDDD